MLYGTDPIHKHVPGRPFNAHLGVNNSIRKARKIYMLPLVKHDQAKHFNQIPYDRLGHLTNPRPQHKEQVRDVVEENCIRVQVSARNHERVSNDVHAIGKVLRYPFPQVGEREPRLVVRSVHVQLVHRPLNHVITFHYDSNELPVVHHTQLAILAPQVDYGRVQPQISKGDHAHHSVAH